MSWGAAAGRQALRTAGRTHPQAGTEPCIPPGAPCGEDGPSQLHKAAPTWSCRALPGAAGCLHAPLLTTRSQTPPALSPSCPPPGPWLPEDRLGSRAALLPVPGAFPCTAPAPLPPAPLPPPHGSWEALGGYTPPAMPDTMEATPEAGAPRRPSMVLLDWLFRRCFSSTFSDSSWSMSA